ncbi:MAG TPA: hypothetical protein VGF97_04035 [Rhizomicrobium sp.]|jgi:hypothetical protein
MSQEWNIACGARFGWMRASWPVARLRVSSDCVAISALLLGKCSFAPADVVAIEAGKFTAKAVRIVHARSDLPSNIEVWCGLRSDDLIARISDTGFVPRADKGSEIRAGHVLSIRPAAMAVGLALAGAALALGAVLYASKFGH